MKEYDLFGNEIIKDVLLRDKFIEPPFSVLDTKSGSWQQRKNQWKRLGIKSEVGRESDMTFKGAVKSFDYYRVKEGKCKESKEQNKGRAFLTLHYAKFYIIGSARKMAIY